MSEDRLKDLENANECNDKNGCIRTVYKEIEVAVPIIIEPSVCFKDACVEIIDDPCIIPVPCCMRSNNCQYAIRQKLCVTIPIEFNAIASSGEPICCIDNNCAGVDVSVNSKENKKHEERRIIEVNDITEEDNGIEIKKINEELDSDTAFLFHKKGKKIELKI